MQWEVVVDGIRVGEGPTWRAGTGDVLVTSVHDGVLWLVDPDRSIKRIFGRTGGGPNSLVAADDGGAVIAQNGGIDMRQFGWPGMDHWPEPSSHPPCLQRLGPDGGVSVLAGEGVVQSPNDLVVTGDGSIVFTDPPHWPPPDRWIARILRWRATGAGAWPGTSVLDAEGRLELLDDTEEYRNGIVLDPDERILIVAGDGLRWLDPDGGRDWFVPRLAHGRGDGMAFDEDGTVYVCTGQAVEVVDSGGAMVDHLPLPDGAFVLNCCFGGDDRRTLFVTDAAHNTLLAFGGMPAPGVPVRTWPVPAPAPTG